LVLVQSLGVIRMVISVKPLPHMLSTDRMRKMATSGTADGDTCPARRFVMGTTIVTFKLMLVLTSGDSDVTTSSNDVIVSSLYDALQQQHDV